jgi:hypothetical protein
MGPGEFPTTPPPLDQRITLSDAQADQINKVMITLTKDLDGLPVIVSQQGELISAAGSPTPEVAERLTRVTERLWREGSVHSAREVIRFDEESIEEVERANYILYSVHIAGAVTLTVGWQLSVSLTQVRAEVLDAKEQLTRILDENA